MPESLGMNTDIFVPDNLIAGPAGQIVTDQVTLNTGQNLERGALLGRITASGNYTLSLAASTDGSEIPRAILARDTDAASEDRPTVVYMAGQFNPGAMTFGTGHTATSVKDGLRDKGIFLKTTIPG